MDPSTKDEEEGESDPLIAKEPEDPEPVSFSDDLLDTLKLGAPIFLASLSWVGMRTTDTALLGHVSAEALTAAALSDLWTMCTSPLMMGQVLGILVGGAVGAGNPKLAGIYLQVSYCVLGVIAVFVFVAWNFTEQVWVAFGSDPAIAHDAGYFARAISFSIPGLVIFGQLSQFFSAQRIMHPAVNASALALVANLVFGLFFVLGIPVRGWDGYGFKACPLVTMTMVYIELSVVYFVYIRIQRLHEPCWGGWSFAEITRERIWTFSELYFPTALGMASDFWRVAVIGTVAARLGQLEVAVFNTSYRIMWIALVVTSAISGASGIKMSMRLGKLDHVAAKQAGDAGVTLAAKVLFVLSFFILWQVRAFGRIFTEDEEFLQQFESAKWPFTVTLFLMNMSIALERIPVSMGRTSIVFWMGLIASWGAQVPAVILLCRYWREDLVGLYTGMMIGYFVLCLLYGAIAYTSDWEKYAKLARQRSEATENSEESNEEK